MDSPSGSQCLTAFRDAGPTRGAKARLAAEHADDREAYQAEEAVRWRVSLAALPGGLVALTATNSTTIWTTQRRSRSRSSSGKPRAACQATATRRRQIDSPASRGASTCGRVAVAELHVLLADLLRTLVPVVMRSTRARDEALGMCEVLGGPFFELVPCLAAIRRVRGRPTRAVRDPLAKCVTRR